MKRKAARESFLANDGFSSVRHRRLATRVAPLKEGEEAASRHHGGARARALSFVFVLSPVSLFLATAGRARTSFSCCCRRRRVHLAIRAQQCVISTRSLHRCYPICVFVCFTLPSSIGGREPCLASLRRLGLRLAVGHGGTNVVTAPTSCLYPEGVARSPCTRVCTVHLTFVDGKGS